MILNEGGNIWPDIEPFSKQEAESILKNAQSLMPPGLDLIPVGSAGHKPSSGDMDLMIDADQVMQLTNTNDEKSARSALKTYMLDRGIPSVQTGVNVHIKLPNGDKFAQVDIMLVKSAERVSKFHQHDYTIEKTPFKGVHKHILLSSLANGTKTPEFPYGMLWSGFQGLFSRTEDGKKGKLITDVAEDVAKILLNPTATTADLGNVERILEALPLGINDPRVQAALTDEKWPVKPVGTNEWFRNLMNSLQEDSLASSSQSTSQAKSAKLESMLRIAGLK